jgi:hypothetical protein
MDGESGSTGGSSMAWWPIQRSTRELVVIEGVDLLVSGWCSRRSPSTLPPFPLSGGGGQHHIITYHRDSPAKRWVLQVA